MSRIINNAHCRLGYAATSEKGNAKHRAISQLATYKSCDKFHNVMTGVTLKSRLHRDGPDTTSVVLLTSTAAIELIKGLLQQELERPIGLAYDEELQQILKNVEGAIKAQDEEARQVVEAIRR